MMDQRRKAVGQQVMDGIDNTYIEELADFLQVEPKTVTHNWFGPLLAAVAVLALLAAGTINIMHQQRGSDFPAQTDYSETPQPETEHTDANVSDNDAQETTAETAGEVDEEHTEEETSAPDDDNALGEEIENIVNLMYPERSEVYFEALAQRLCTYEAHSAPEQLDEILAERQKELLLEFPQENEINKQRIYDYVETCMNEGESRAHVAERLKQWQEAYPELTDEQELNFNEQYNCYEEKYLKGKERAGGYYEEDVIFEALYYDFIGRPDQQMQIALNLSAEEAKSFIDADWVTVEDGMHGEERNYCYGNISAETILKAIESEKLPSDCFMLRLREEAASSEILSGRSVAMSVLYNKTHSCYKIKKIDGKEYIGQMASYDI
jgi:hypothetical protein